MTVKDSEGRTPLMYASSKGYNEIVNYLTLRTKDLNEEDNNSLTILMHYLFKNEFKMASKLIVRGANVNYVNRNGHTALHLCIENHIMPSDLNTRNHMIEAVNFLLKKGADPHIMDLAGEDACDKAKKNGIALLIPQFNNCNHTLKKKPVLPIIKEEALYSKRYSSTASIRTSYIKDVSKESMRISMQSHAKIRAMLT